MHPLLFAWFNRRQLHYDVLNSNRGFRRKNMVIEMMKMTVRWVSDRLSNGYFYCTDNSICSFQGFFFRRSFVGILKMCQNVKFLNSKHPLNNSNLYFEYFRKGMSTKQKGVVLLSHPFLFSELHRCNQIPHKLNK